MIRSTLALLWLLLSLVPALAQDGAAVEIAYQGTVIQLAGTEQEIALRRSAVTVIGAGDLVRTGESGRAWIQVAGARVLLLPQTSFMIQELRQENGALYFVAQIEGIALAQVDEAVTFSLVGKHYTVSGQAGRFALWTEGQTDEIVAVSAGRFTVTDQQETFQLDAGSAARYRDNASSMVTLEAPFNQARVIGLLDGCAGIVQTRSDAAGVLVRTGAGRGFERRLLVPTGENVQLLAITESGLWYRMQYGNGFGWVAAEAVTSDCDLPTVLDNTPEETQVRVYDAQPLELELLIPYYGRPAFDTWFYDYSQR